jgi:RNA polymerase sigma factor (sigma-70 family)
VADGFEAFCAAEHRRLVGALTLWCGDRGVAEEVVQEAFARAFRDWRRIGVMDEPAAWVRRVAINLATSRFRRWQAERRATRRLSEGHSDSQDDPDVAAAVAIRRGLAQLSTSQRTALVLRYYLDAPVSEVAALTGRSETAVTSLTQRALEALRAKVGAVAIDAEQEVRHD